MFFKRHEDIYNEMSNGEFRHIFADMGTGNESNS